MANPSDSDEPTPSQMCRPTASVRRYSKQRIVEGVVAFLMTCALCFSVLAAVRFSRATKTSELAEKVSRESADGDGFLDKGWQEMWNSLPAGYAAVKKELSGYNPDGSRARTKPEKKANHELSTYSDILGNGDTRPNHERFGTDQVREKTAYDHELSSYDNILSFGPAHGGDHHTTSKGGVLAELNQPKQQQRRRRASRDKTVVEKPKLPKSEGDALLYDEWQVLTKEATELHAKGGRTSAALTSAVAKLDRLKQLALAVKQGKAGSKELLGELGAEERVVQNVEEEQQREEARRLEAAAREAETRQRAREEREEEERERQRREEATLTEERARKQACTACLSHWTPEALLCVHRSCAASSKANKDEGDEEQLALNFQLASLLHRCMGGPFPAAGSKQLLAEAEQPADLVSPQRVVVTGFVLPWKPPFAKQTHSWVKVQWVEAAGLAGLGLRTGQTPSLVLGGERVGSAEHVMCKPGVTIAHELKGIEAKQRKLNEERALRYFSKVSTTPEAARRKADAALERVVPADAVLGWSVTKGIGVDGPKQARPEAVLRADEESRQAQMERVIDKREKEERKVLHLEREVRRQRAREHGGGRGGGGEGVGGGGDDAEVALTRTLRAKQALLDEIQAKKEALGATARTQRQDGRHHAISFLKSQLEADQEALGTLQHGEKGEAEKDGQVVAGERQAREGELARLKEERLERKHQYLLAALRKIRAKLHSLPASHPAAAHAVQ